MPALSLKPGASSPLPGVAHGRKGKGTRSIKGRTIVAAAPNPPDALADKKVVILGGGIIGNSCAYFLSKRGVPCTVVERVEIAAAASGKSGGFLAGGWGDGSNTETLHRESFKLHEQLAETLGLTTYRKIPTLQVAGGERMPLDPPVSWLDGDVAMARLMDDATAQVTPLELTQRLHEEAMSLTGAATVFGEVVDVKTIASESSGSSDGSALKVSAVTVHDESTGTTTEIDADVVIVAMGPWSTRASEWFPDFEVPMTGVKSVSLVYEASDAVANEPAALFCAEDNNGCHLEVYPRSTGEVYICGCGGSEYITEDRLLPGGDLAVASAVKPDQSRVAAATRSFGGLSASVGGDGPRRSQSCMRPCPPDAVPYLGAVPGVEGAYMACGHNCWGILWAPVTGKIVSELVVDGKSSIDLTAFTPGRFMTTAQKRGKKIKGVNVGEQW